MSKSRRNSKRQIGLIKAGLHGLKVGGKLLYSTCSISSIENDEVIANILKKHTLKLHQDFQGSLLEKTQYGFQVLPDKTGFGPIYFCLLSKPN